MRLKGLLDNSGFLIAIATSYVYLLAYLGLYIKADYYGIPKELLSMGVQEVANIAVMCFWMCMALSLYFYILVSFYNSIFKWLRVLAVSILIIPILSLIPLCYVLLSNINKQKIYMIFPIIFSLFVVWILRFDIKGSFSKGYQNPDSILYKIYFIFTRHVQVAYAIFIALLIPAIFIFCAHKYFSLLYQVKYDTFYKKGCYASLNYSSDTLIAKKIADGKLMDGFFIFKTESIEGTEIIKRNITSNHDMATCGSPASRVVEPYCANRQSR